MAISIFLQIFCHVSSGHFIDKIACERYNPNNCRDVLQYNEKGNKLESKFRIELKEIIKNWAYQTQPD